MKKTYVKPGLDTNMFAQFEDVFTFHGNGGGYSGGRGPGGGHNDHGKPGKNDYPWPGCGSAS